MIKNFSQYLVEEEREVYFTFGRMNPPTIGHGKVMDTLASKSGKADYKVYLSQVSNPKKDPLSYSDKVKHVRKMFPKHARSVMIDKDVKNVFDVASRLYDQGYKKITMVVGDDRVREFDVLLNKYNGTKARHGFYNFQSIRVVSAGKRDPDAEGVEGMSASKQRENASKNDFVTFAQGVPKSMSDKDARKLFNDVRKGMGLQEERSFKNHIELAPVSETREQYVQGELYGIGDTVVIKETEECATVSMLGANYVIVERTDGTRLRKWLDAVELVERQDPDIKDREGTQPARYHAGLKKSTKVARDAHFKKHGKKDDDDASAYKPAPGDATAKTKPSKYTKGFKDMYGESVTEAKVSVGDRVTLKPNKSVLDRSFIGKAGVVTNMLDGDAMVKFANGRTIAVSPRHLKINESVSEANEKEVHVRMDNLGKDEDKVVDILQKYEKKGVLKFDGNTDKGVIFKLLKPAMLAGLNRELKRFYTDAQLSEGVELTFESIFSRADGGPETTGQMISRWASKTVKKGQYDQVAKYIRNKMEKEKGNKHSAEFHAAEIIRKTGLKLDPKALALVVRNENSDPVKIARKEIDREKEQDKLRHDRILDRARIARAKQKNRETKP